MDIVYSGSIEVAVEAPCCTLHRDRDTHSSLRAADSPKAGSAQSQPSPALANNASGGGRTAMSSLVGLTTGLAAAAKQHNGRSPVWRSHQSPCYDIVTIIVIVALSNVILLSHFAGFLA